MQLLLLRDEALLPWGHSPGLSPAPRGAPPPWMPFVSLFLFPRLPTLIEARTLLTVAFQLFCLSQAEFVDFQDNLKIISVIWWGQVTWGPYSSAIVPLL